MSAESTTTNIQDLGTSLGNDVPASTNAPQSEDNFSAANPEVSLDQGTINQIVNGLQQASITGATSLPSRDIPTNTDNIIQDIQVQPNHIPQSLPQYNKDYIAADETEEDEVIQSYYKNRKRDNEASVLYDELQYPILVAILYFLFQLPVVKQLLFKSIPMLFGSDGNFNINGLILTSGLFGGVFYIIFKSIYFCSKINM